jgi:hypothetical protein
MLCVCPPIYDPCIQAHEDVAFLQVASSASLFQGSALTKSVPLRTARPFRSINVVVKAAEDRLRLHNLSPAEGSRRQEKRKGRGHAAGQVSYLPYLHISALGSRGLGHPACSIK